MNDRHLKAASALAGLALAALAALSGPLAHAQTAQADPSAASLPAPVAQPGPLTSADAPAYTVGEQWTFSYKNELEPAKNTTYTQTVTGVGGGQVQLNNGSVVLDASGNIVKAETNAYQPSDQKLSFPLAVGKSWSASYVYQSGSWAAQATRQSKVVGVERVDTPAGSFDAFRIEHVVSWLGTNGNRGQGVTHETDWYAPAVGRIVKMDFSDQAAHSSPTTTHLVLTHFAKP
jgi:hypothetical protein